MRTWKDEIERLTEANFRLASPAGSFAATSEISQMRFGMGTTATTLHADLDAFYASVEQFSTQLCAANLLRWRRSCALSIINEAKAFGISGGIGPAARDFVHTDLCRWPFQGVSAAGRRSDQRAQ